MKRFLPILLLLGLSAFSATLSEFKPLDKTVLSQRVYAFDFEAPAPPDNFRIPKGYSWKHGNGENGNGGLALSRAADEKYTFASVPLPDLKPGMRYKLSGMVAIDGLTNKTTGQPVNESVQTIGFDFSKNNTYVSSSYVHTPKLIKGKLDWQSFSLTFTVPDDCRATLCFFVKEFNVRSLNWDNIVIESLGEQQPLLYPTMPKHLLLTAKGDIRLRAYDFLTKRPETALVAFAKLPDGRELSSPINGGFANFTLGQLPEGCHDIRFYLCDTSTRRVIGEDHYPFTVTTRTPPKGGVFTDETGRMFIDGKPFFPVAIYMESSTFTPAEMAELKSIGINTILPYRNLKMRLPEEQGKTTSTLPELRRSLDILQQNNFKICLCLIDLFGRIGNTTELDGRKGADEILPYLVDGLKNHPALLGYYISDENPVDQLGPIKNARFIISQHDPFHPVATLTNIPNHYVYFAPTGDIMMIDKYPIRNQDTQSIKPIYDAFQKEHQHSQLGIWWVPQIFNWGIYFRYKPYKEWRYPTEEEMRSQNLLSLNHRARAVFHYAYHSIRKQERMDRGSTQWYWPRVANVVKLTAELEPFFMEDTAPAPVPLENKGPSPIDAKLHKANDGREIAVIVSLGPGQADAVLNIGRTGLKSRFGHTTEIGGGKYRYTSTDIASDILE